MDLDRSGAVEIALGFAHEQLAGEYRMTCPVDENNPACAGLAQAAKMARLMINVPRFM